MKCWTDPECKQWFDEMQISIGPQRELLLSPLSSVQGFELWTSPPESVTMAAAFAERVVSWLPRTRTKMLWLKDWRTEPTTQMHVVRSIRRLHNEIRRIIDAPGHIFEESPPLENEDGFQELEDRGEDFALMSTLFFLMMGYDWECYMLSEQGDSMVLLLDQIIVFHSASETKFQEAGKIVEDFKTRTWPASIG